MDKEKHIIHSWEKNACNWIDIIDNNGIESRRLITNQAITDALVSHKPGSVFDIGCGEGWLAKQLFDRGISVTGIDVIPAFIKKAKEKSPGNFYLGSYDDIAAGNIKFETLFDAIVINFALIGKESTEKLLTALPAYMALNGKLFIQTLHPHSRKAINDYQSGWKEGSWDGLGETFTEPYQWYFRTMEDWLEILGQSGFTNITITEIFHPQSNLPLSVIFALDCRARVG